MNISALKTPYYGNGISTKVCGNAPFNLKEKKVAKLNTFHFLSRPQKILHQKQ